MLSKLIEEWETRIHRVLDELEDPEVVLDESLRAQAKLLTEVKADLREVVADEQQARDELDQHRQAKREWGEKATQALTAGGEDLAREALAKGLELELVVRDLEKVYYRRKADAEVLTSIVEKMEKGHAELDRDKAVLLARLCLAELDKNLAQLRVTYDIDSQGGSTARMRARTEIEDATQRKIADNELELAFAALEADLVQEKVQAKLARMKQAMQADESS